nr:hypothetical protein CcurKRNrm1_p081 [Cryptomonas curvata]
MNSIILLNRKDTKIFNLIQKIFQNLNISRKYFFSKYKKNSCLVFHYRFKNLVKNLWEIDIFFLYKFLVISLKLKPILTNVKIKISHYIFKTVSIQMFVITKIFKNQQFINVPSFLRFYFNRIRNIKHKIRFHSYSICKLPDIFFEETADEIKFIFNTNFIRLFLSLNSGLGRCWLMLKFSFFKILNFWKIYVNSCYNLLTRCKKIFEINQYKDDNNVFKISNDQKYLDFEIFYLRKIQNTNFYFRAIKHQQKNSFEFDCDELLSNLEFKAIKWRNRHLNKLFLHKNYKLPVKSIIKKKFILLIF